MLDRARPIDNPHVLDFIQLRGADGDVIPLRDEEAAEEEAVVGIRRTTLAARLKAIYGSVDKLDAFVGMLSERHLQRTEFGPLQLAIWERQFRALRDGDRFHYLNDPLLPAIRSRYGVDYRQTLARVIRMNTDAPVRANPFKAPQAGPDTTPPAVSLNAVIASSSVILWAAASDDIGVAGVQLMLDGKRLGPEDTSAPFEVTWDASAAARGSHRLGAIARDAAGNKARAATLTVLVSRPRKHFRRGGAAWSERRTPGDRIEGWSAAPVAPGGCRRPSDSEKARLRFA